MNQTKRSAHDIVRFVVLEAVNESVGRSVDYGVYWYLYRSVLNDVHRSADWPVYRAIFDAVRW